MSVPLIVSAWFFTQVNQETQTTQVVSGEIVKYPQSESIEDKIVRYADKYNLNRDKFYRTIICENNTLDPHRQSQLKYNFSDPRRDILVGEQERSYGLAMIHLPDHPEITLEQATNADFSLNWMASEWSKGRAWQWTCWKLLSSYGS